MLSATACGAFITEHAPPIEAREGHRAPVDADAGGVVAHMVRRPVRRGLRRCRLARRARRAGRPPSAARSDRQRGDPAGACAAAGRPGQPRRTCAAALRQRSSAEAPTCRRSGAASTCGASCSASPTRAATSPRCAAARWHQQDGSWRARRPEDVDHRRPLGRHGFGADPHRSVVGATSWPVGVRRAAVGAGGRGASDPHDRRCHRGQRGLSDRCAAAGRLHDRRGRPGLVDHHGRAWTSNGSESVATSSCSSCSIDDLVLLARHLTDRRQAGDGARGHPPAGGRTRGRSRGGQGVHRRPRRAAGTRRRAAGRRFDREAELRRDLPRWSRRMEPSWPRRLRLDGPPDSPCHQAKQRLRECWLWSRAYTISGGSSEMMRNILAKRRLMLPSMSDEHPTPTGVSSNAAASRASGPCRCCPTTSVAA